MSTFPFLDDIDEAMGRTTTRTTTTAELSPEASVGIRRTGQPKDDLSGFEVTKRVAVVTLAGKTYALSSAMTRRLAGALMEAAATIDREETT